MFENLDLFLTGESSLRVEKSGEPTAYDLQVATAVLLIHMGRKDDNLNSDEINSAVRSLVKQFQIGDTQAGGLLHTADLIQESPEKVSELMQVIDERFEKSQKITLIAEIWKTMKADGLVSRVEASFAAEVAQALNLDRDDILKAQELAG